VTYDRLDRLLDQGAELVAQPIDTPRSNEELAALGDDTRIPLFLLDGEEGLELLCEATGNQERVQQVVYLTLPSAETQEPAQTVNRQGEA